MACSGHIFPKRRYSLSVGAGKPYWTRDMEKKCGIEILEIGSERNLAVIVDGFAADPDRWRNDAAPCDFRPMGDFYLGCRAPAPPAYLAPFGPPVGAVCCEL